MTSTGPKNFSTRAEAIRLRTYARPREDGRLESWDETVDRVLRHTAYLWNSAGGAINYEEISELGGYIRSRALLPAGRTLWLGGTDVAYLRAASQFNCSFSTARTVLQIVDIFWLLLQGCGDGFRPEVGTLRGFTRPIPTVQVIPSQRPQDYRGPEENSETYEDGVWRITVGDSAEAWAKSVGKLLVHKYPDAHTLIIDLSEIRGAGGRLAGYGWLCNGSEPLGNAYRRIAAILNRRHGQLLTELDILDVVNHLGTVLSSRRSAQIAIMDYGSDRWREFARAKKDFWLHGNEHRQQSNNSLVFWSKPSREQLEELFEIMADAGGSEPGFINGKAAKKRAPWFSGINPCFAEGTLVPLPERGLVRIEDMDNKYEYVYDSREQSMTKAQFKKTGDNQPIWEVELSNGSVHRVTKTHNWVLEDGQLIQTRDLEDGMELDAVMFPCFGQFDDVEYARNCAWQIADGTWHSNPNKSKIYLYGDKKQYVDQFGTMKRYEDAGDRYTLVWDHPPLDKARIPDSILQGTARVQKAFIENYIYADGHKSRTEKGLIIQVTSIHRSFLQELQSMLYSFGVKSKISMLRESGYKDMPGGVYYCQTSWRLSVSNPARLCEHIWPEDVRAGAYNKPLRLFVTRVEETEETSDVYCCGVPTTGTFYMPGFISGNCAEILLADGGFCNLVEVDLGKFTDDFSGLCRAVYLAARMNYRQTCVDLNDGILQGHWHQTNEALRLCGVSVTGIARSNLTDYEIKTIRDEAVRGAHSMAEELGLEHSKNVTTIKPSGTVSKIMDTTEGVHTPLGKYIFNWVSHSVHDPLVQKAKDAGYKTITHPTDSTSVLICFPVCWEGVKFDVVDGKEVNLESAVSQLERYRRWQTLWCDQNVSNTISYSPEEVPEIIDWLLDNWDAYVGVSWLYRVDPTKTAKDLGYLYLPQEVVTKETYEQYTKQLQEIDFSEIEGIFDPQEDGCEGGACPVR